MNTLKFVIKIGDTRMELEIPVVDNLMREHLGELGLKFKQELKFELLKKLASDSEIHDAICQISAECEDKRIAAAKVILSRNSVAERDDQLNEKAKKYAKLLINAIAFEILTSEELEKIVTAVS